MSRIMDLFRAKKPPEKPPAPAVSAGRPGDAVPPPPETPPVSPEPPAVEPAPVGASNGPGGIEGKVVDILRNTFDPEIPVNIYELGLIYEARVEDSGEVFIKMTLTSPACPVAGTLPPEVESRVRNIPGVTSVQLDLVWDPPWNPNMMSEAARLQLGMM